VRQWRKAHPDYWKRKQGRRGKALQKECDGGRAGRKEDSVTPAEGTLQNDWVPQDPFLAGLAAEVTGCTLQNEFVAACRRMLAKGREILSKQTSRSS
jgi:hypothetical protein